jgi:hypothetical protein
MTGVWDLFVRPRDIVSSGKGIANCQILERFVEQ